MRPVRTFTASYEDKRVRRPEFPLAEAVAWYLEDMRTEIVETTWHTYRSHLGAFTLWLPATARDAVVLGACLACEQSSLPAFWHLARFIPRALRRRRDIMRRRRISDEDLAAWFNGQPSFPLTALDAQTELDRLAV